MYHRCYGFKPLRHPCVCSARGCCHIDSGLDDEMRQPWDGTWLIVGGKESVASASGSPAAAPGAEANDGVVGASHAEPLAKLMPKARPKSLLWPRAARPKAAPKSLLKGPPRPSGILLKPDNPDRPPTSITDNGTTGRCRWCFDTKDQELLRKIEDDIKVARCCSTCSDGFLAGVATS